MASVKEKVTSKPVKEHEQSYNKILRTLVDNAQLSTNPTFPIPIETCCDQCCPETGLVSPEELVDIGFDGYGFGGWPIKFRARDAQIRSWISMQDPISTMRSADTSPHSANTASAGSRSIAHLRA